MSQRINTSLPVNKSHPLNRGLVSWWMNMPNRWGGGGLVLRDIAGVNHASIVGSGISYKGKVRSGYGSVDNDGTQANIEIPKSLVATEVNSSVFMWIQTSQGTNGGFGRSLFADRSSSTPIWKLDSLSSSASENRLFFTHRDDSSSLTFVVGNTAINDGVPHYVGVTKSGTSITLFMDGLVDGSGTLNGDDSLTSTTTSIISDAADSNASQNDFKFDDIRLYHRTLSVGEVRALYNESLRGHPNTLNFSDPSYAVPSAPAAPTGFPFQRYYLGGAA